jgi:hypothetical protein
LTNDFQPPIDQPLEQAPRDAARYPWRS